MNDSQNLSPGGIRYGVAYYPEYHLEDRLELDLDMMAEAGLSVIRVGESVWSTWEPRDGEFNLDWMQPVLDGALSRGIDVVLGTPTYAVPPWLQVAEPDIAAEIATGKRVPWGARQEMDFTHPTYRFHAERVIRAILDRHATHPAIIGFQVDNEPGLHLFHNDRVFNGFIDFLRERYGDVETLNREWGLTYWSHMLNDFSELWRPDGNSFPQYDLAWRIYQAGLTEDFIGWQAEIVREYKLDNQFVTTCVQYQQRPALDDELLSNHLEVAAGNPYYAMQDRLQLGDNQEPLTEWTTSGVASLFRQADRLYSSKQQRFLVTETNAQAISGSSMNHPPYPGQLKQAALALISRGAAMIEYWHWHTLPYGTETYWGGVLPHSLKPGRIFEEVSEIAGDLSKIEPNFDGYEPDYDVGILWSNESRFAMEFMPPFEIDGEPDSRSYEHIIDSFHAGIIHSQRQARFVHPNQALNMGVKGLLKRFPVLIAAGLYVTSDDTLQLLREYVEAGGHLILGPRTGYADEEARARVEVSPPRLSDLAGVHYSEFSNISQKIGVSMTGKLENQTQSAESTMWIDGLIADSAEVLATYDHPHFSTFPAVTTKDSGKGAITVVGCIPDVNLSKAVIEFASSRFVTEELLEDVPSQIRVSSGTNSLGQKIWFVFNWGWEEESIVVTSRVRDLLSEARVEVGDKISLGSWSTKLLISEKAGA